MKKAFTIILAAAGFVLLFAEGDSFKASLILKGVAALLLLIAGAIDGIKAKKEA